MTSCDHSVTISMTNESDFVTVSITNLRSRIWPGTECGPDTRSGSAAVSGTGPEYPSIRWGSARPPDAACRTTSASPSRSSPPGRKREVKRLKTVIPYRCDTTAEPAFASMIFCWFTDVVSLIEMLCGQEGFIISTKSGSKIICAPLAVLQRASMAIKYSKIVCMIRDSMEKNYPI